MCVCVCCLPHSANVNLKALKQTNTARAFNSRLVDTTENVALRAGRLQLEGGFVFLFVGLAVLFFFFVLSSPVELTVASGHFGQSVV